MARRKIAENLCCQVIGKEIGEGIQLIHNWDDEARVRVIRHGDLVTCDWVMDRFNLYVDDQDIITDARMG